MKSLALLNQDLVFRDGDLQPVDGILEINQSIELDFGTNVSDWFLNELLGCNHILLLEKSTDDMVRAEVLRVISNEERIIEIKDLEIINDFTNRIRKIKFTAELENQEILPMEVNVVVGA